jgi:hypothetical protein
VLLHQVREAVAAVGVMARVAVMAVGVADWPLARGRAVDVLQQVESLI